MNSKFKKIAISLSVIVGVFCAGYGFAQSDNTFIPPDKGGLPLQNGHDALPVKPFGPERLDGSAKNIRRGPSREVFEARLNLTQEQKDIAKAQREKSIEKIKPIMEQIKSKKAEIQTVKMTKMAPRAIDERVTQLENEIRELRKQAHEIRRENMKAFEATLTEEQKKELQKMKEEGRKRFERERKKMNPKAM